MTDLLRRLTIAEVKIAQLEAEIERKDRLMEAATEVMAVQDQAVTRLSDIIDRMSNQLRGGAPSAEVRH